MFLSVRLTRSPKRQTTGSSSPPSRQIDLVITIEDRVEDLGARAPWRLENHTHNLLPWAEAKVDMMRML